VLVLVELTALGPAYDVLPGLPPLLPKRHDSAIQSRRTLHRRYNREAKPFRWSYSDATRRIP
jgi:hypothetical protein